MSKPVGPDSSSREKSPGRVRILTIFGTRPEAIKLAPVVHEIERHPESLEVRTVVSAQHREMLDCVLELFDLVPDHDLNIMRAGQDLFDITCHGLAGLKRVLKVESPDFVLVQGDTTTTLVGALGAHYFKIPVGHVEAGLRTRDRYHPFPEEINRQLVTVLSEIHFPPTRMSRANLLAEGVPAGRILVTGNTVVDALLAIASRAPKHHDESLEPFGRSKRMILVTAHRRESFGGPMREMFTAFQEVAKRHPDVEIVYPVHLNPNVLGPAREILGGQERIHLIVPQPYDQFVHLMKRAHLILTDSGGIQEEAPALGKPVLVMRETTERPEGIEAGTVKLVGTSARSIQSSVARLLTDGDEYHRMATATNPYGDGHASRRIVDWILSNVRRPEAATLRPVGS